MTTQMPSHAYDLDLDLASIATRYEFGRALTVVRERAGLTIRDVAKATEILSGTLGGYYSGRHVPQIRDDVPAILAACGVDDPAPVTGFLDAFDRVRRAPGPRPSDAPVPYRGLASFQSEDAQWFFGRERLTDLLVLRVAGSLDAGGMLLVVGPSGSGKSSLLRAGLVAAASRGALGSVDAVLLTPGSDPVRALSDQLDAAGDSGSGRTLLVVDQFEEVYAPDVSESDREAFIARLCRHAGRTDSVPTGDRRAMVVLGLRADFYPHALRHPVLAALSQDAQLVVEPMSPGELRDAIVEPARHAGFEVEESLVELLLHDVAPRGGDPAVAYDAGALPLLSHALLATWEHALGGRLTVDDYRASEGIHGAVAYTAEAVYGGLTPAQQDIARRLFVRLVHVGPDTADTRRHVGHKELADVAGADPVGIDVVLDRFVDHRLVTADVDSVEITHEALLRAWPRLQEWIEADREGLQTLHRLADATRIWDDESREPQSLYRGARLEAAREWAADPAHAADLNQTERDFLDASIAADDAQREAEQRRGRRRRRVTALLTLLALVTSALSVTAWRLRIAADDERAVALSRLAAIAADRLRANDVALATQLSLAAYRIARTTEAMSSVLTSGAAPRATRLLGSDAIMQSVAVRSDGAVIAAGSADGTIRLWDLSGPRPASLGTPLTGPDGAIYAVAFDPKGHLLAAAGAGHTVALWDVTDPRRPEPVGPPLAAATNTVYSLAFDPTGTLLAAGSADKTVRLWNVRDPADIRALPPLIGATDYVHAVAFSPDGRTVAAGSADKTIRMWTIADSARPRARGGPLTGPTDVVYAVAFSPDGRTLAAGSKDRLVRLWDVSDPDHPARLGKPLDGAGNWVNAVAFSPDGRQLAAGSADATVRIWDLTSRTLVTTLPHPGPVTSIVFRSGTRSWATAAADGVVRLWDLPMPTATGSTDAVYATAFSPTVPILVAGGRDHRVRFWDVSDRTRPALLDEPQIKAGAAVASVAFARDGKTLGIAVFDGTVELWDTTDVAHAVRKSRVTATAGVPVESLALSPDGRMLAAGSDDNKVWLWDVTDVSRPRLAATVTGPESIVFSVAFSPDSRTLVAGSADKAVWLWNVADMGRPTRLGSPLRGAKSDIYSVAFSPDGRTLAVGSADKTLRLWDMTDPSRPIPLGDALAGPNGYVYSVAFSPDGRTLASGNTDKTVWLWNVTDRRRIRPIATLTGATDNVYTVAFSPDSQAVAAGGQDAVVRIFETSPDRVAETACASVGDVLTPAEWHQYIPGLRYDPPCTQ